MTAPLAGVRVVEVASYVAAPAAGALLADLGAEVIKVEVAGGELMRHTRPRMNGFRSDFDASPAFEMDNRGKRSLTLDLQREPGREALRRVVDGADVVLTNLLPGRRRRFGLDADTLLARKPSLVVAGLTGYGGRGPEADRPSFDYAAYWARTGMMDLFREPGSPPTLQRPGVGDHSAALSLVVGILAALRVRDATGEGQEVDVSLVQIGLYLQGNDLAQCLATGQPTPHHDRRRPRNPLWNQYRTADDRWLLLVMIESPRYWPTFVRAIERQELEDDPRFSGPVERYRNSEALVAILDELFAGAPLAVWEERLERHRLIWAPVRHMHEVADDPQVRAMGYLREVEHPEVGRHVTMGPPLVMSRHAMPADRPAPALGVDNEALLRAAGLDEAEIAEVLAAPD